MPGPLNLPGINPAPPCLHGTDDDAGENAYRSEFKSACKTVHRASSVAYAKRPFEYNPEMHAGTVADDTDAAETAQAWKAHDA